VGVRAGGRAGNRWTASSVAWVVAAVSTVAVAALVSAVRLAVVVTVAANAGAARPANIKTEQNRLKDMTPPGIRNLDGR
jgi:hypothetical protein